MSRTQGAQRVPERRRHSAQKTVQRLEDQRVVSAAQLACGYCLGSHQEVEKGGNEKIGWAGVGRK